MNTPSIIFIMAILGFGYYCYKQFKEVGRKSTVKLPSSNWVYFKKRTDPIFCAYNAVTCKLVLVSWDDDNWDDDKVCITRYQNAACNMNHHLTTYLRENAAHNPFHYGKITPAEFIEQFNSASDKFDFTK